jgi:catechol 2,3-dioxygenase-like lactoylglutathione lyase family enzyme
VAFTSGEAFVWRRLVPELDVSDLEASLRFYTDLLGFSVLFRRAGFAYLELEGVQFMLQAAAQDDWLTATLQYPFGRGVNFQIELDDIAPLQARLAQAAYPLYREARDAWYETGDIVSGQREFLVQDPDGYLLRFCQALGEKPLPR